ncbi:MAG TPA: UPF0175 family protein [Tepidisphaeraceae bacterium]|nr:UPF0175 family protein [Tepidisphaeraceae bacterium]
MALLIDIPKDVEQSLREQWGDLERAATEALVIESYRAGKLSLGGVGRALGLPTSLAAQDWLAARGVELNYDLNDLEADRATLGRLFEGRP